MPNHYLLTLSISISHFKKYKSMRCFFLTEKTHMDTRLAFFMHFTTKTDIYINSQGNEKHRRFS